MTSRTIGVCVAFSFVLLATGCGPKGPAMIPVTGTVKLDGAPVAGAGVTFMPVSGGRPATGETDANGNFKLTTEKANDGALEGDYLVAVSGVRTVGVVVNPDGTSGDTTNMRTEWFVPQKYAKPATSNLQQTVSKGMGSVDLNLSSK